MLDLNLIREQPDVIKEGLRKRNDNPTRVDAILEYDTRRRAVLTEVETLRAERNRLSKEIGRSKDPAAREHQIAIVREMRDQIGALEEKLREVESVLEAEMSQLPALPHA
ncbi:MAG TPA: serine--tRNA ligase, partial [Chloroflexi bacterium]|nr:serine--tRNA ligase [Chloroflexota bacterium]